VHVPSFPVWITESTDGVCGTTSNADLLLSAATDSSVTPDGACCTSSPASTASTGAPASAVGAATTGAGAGAGAVEAGAVGTAGGVAFGGGRGLFDDSPPR